MNRISLISSVIFLLITVSACSRVENINLGTSWKISYSDSYEFKEKNINDSTWEKITLPVQTDKNVTTVWIRNTFTLPDALKKKPVYFFREDH